MKPMKTIDIVLLLSIIAFGIMLYYFFTNFGYSK